MIRRSAARWFYNGIDPIGKVHPDQLFGNSSVHYRGKGWAAFWKQLPQENMLIWGGSTIGNVNDRQGWIRDPEDPRHPTVRLQIGERQGFDGAIHAAVYANFGPIPEGSRLLQVLYENYLEPFSCHRVAGILKHYEKCPNRMPWLIASTCDYICDSCALVGNVTVCLGTAVLHSTVMRGDTNAIYVAEGTQILENCCLLCDAPSTLYHYERGEAFNPYQTFEAMDGVCRIGCNCVIEANCMLDSCHIGPFSKIGHNTKIMKGVTTGILVHVLPGSVVIADTHMHDGELWGGAPARKLGKISKFEWKKPYFASIIHREMVCDQHTEFTRWGDQVVHHQEAMDQLTSLAIEFENDLPETIRAQIKNFVEGKEPYQHTVARLTQCWVPANRADDKASDHLVPLMVFNSHREHNDETGEPNDYVGSIMNLKAWLTEKRW